MQQKLQTLQEILQLAIQREIEARELYTRTAGMVEDEQAQGLLKELAAQEEGHRRRLEALLEDPSSFSRLTRRKEPMVDLGITDFLQETPLDEEADIQQILIVAGKREGGSYDFYTALAMAAEDPEIEGLFRYLADQELEHKHRIERLYEELFYSDL